MIITGNYLVKYQADWVQLPLQEIYLECDTSLAPVTINLFKINETNRFWNVSIHISDISNNANSNNITVVAGAGDTIDDITTSNLVINNDGGSAILQIANDTSWIALESVTGGSAPAIPIYIDKTFIELQALMTAGTLIKGAMYRITDFQTIYDQPDYDAGGIPKPVVVTKTAPIEPLVVQAISANQISNQAFQPLYPNDKVLYDVTFTQTEVMGAPAKGRITERIDALNNRTDYDHRNVLYIRYESVSGSGVFNSYKDTGFASTELPTFNDLAYDNNNYIGDTFIYKALYSEFFGLGNNVFGAFFEGNEIGVWSYNNTIGDYAFYNKIGDGSKANVIGDGFRNNDIGNDFSSNIIGLNFQSNIIATSFRSNDIFGDAFFNFSWNKISSVFEQNFISSSFARNTITNDCIQNTINCQFEYNLLQIFSQNITGVGYFNANNFGLCSGNTFGDNTYGNITSDFSNNFVGNNFGVDVSVGNSGQGNRIGGFCEGNTIGTDFVGNDIGNYFRQNTIGDSFINNSVRNYFNTNIIGANFEENRLGNFFENNQIGTFFQNNSIENNFRLNTIGNSFLQNTVAYSCNGNTMATGVFSNNIGANFAFNDTGANFRLNIVGDNFASNIIGVNFENNTFGTTVTSNTIGERFRRNNSTHQFTNNTIGNDVTQNSFGIKFIFNSLDSDSTNNEFILNNQQNTFGFWNKSKLLGSGNSSNTFIDVENCVFNCSMTQNTIGTGCINNEVNGFMTSNTIGDNFRNNYFKLGFGGFIIGNTFQKNTFYSAPSPTDFTPATHVYAIYDCFISQREDATHRLTYMDNTDVNVVTSITA